MYVLVLVSIPTTWRPSVRGGLALRQPPEMRGRKHVYTLYIRLGPAILAWQSSPSAKRPPCVPCFLSPRCSRSPQGGHGIGKLFHTNPNILHYKNNESNGIMKEGHTFTIEPMICEGTGEVFWLCLFSCSGPMCLPAVSGVRAFSQASMFYFFASEVLPLEARYCFFRKTAWVSDLYCSRFTPKMAARYRRKHLACHLCQRAVFFAVAHPT